MPAYGSSPATSLGNRVWNAETVAAGAASLAVALDRDVSEANCVSVEVLFAANPGTFKIDLQTADTDSEPYYVTKASLDTGLNASFVGRIEATNVVAQRVRLKMVTLTNAVAVTAKVC